ncbi:MAG: SprT family zinc-dependent metalloprotease [Pseudomonadota bacterium]
MAFGFFRQTEENELPNTLSVAGRDVPLTVRENARAKRLTMRIQPGSKGITITVPPGTRTKVVDDFIMRHAGWLETQIAKQPDRPKVRAGIKLPIRGVNHMIKHESGRGVTEVRDGQSGPELVVRGDEKFLARRVADFLKAEAKHDIDALVAHHAGKVGRRVKSVRYRDTTSRWGSCSSDANLSFSWRIMMAPPSVINYLVAHECAHLREMNHGPNFWALCEELCPDTKRCKQWLKRNGGKLQAIEF